MAVTFAAALFRDGDLKCMGKAGVKLDDPNWASANATLVYGAVADGKMPPDKPWSPVRLSLFKAWIYAGHPA